MYEIPSRKDQTEVVVTAEMVENVVKRADPKSLDLKDDKAKSVAIPATDATRRESA
jgi:hypothetical protein